MKSDVRKRSICMGLVMTAILALVVPVGAGVEEIPPGPETVLPDYIGAPAKAHPTANSGVPQNLFLAPNPFNSAHDDPWMSDVVDIAEQLQVVVFRTDERLGPKETRKVCEVPVFDFEGGKDGAASNSLIGSRLSLIVENTYGYAMYWQQNEQEPSARGFERIDINPNGKSCTKVWSNPDVASTISGRLSTRTGLIYIYARKMDTSKVDEDHPYGLDVYYLTALDFRTGEVVWEKQVGTGFAFDHYYTALLVGTDETVNFGLYGGIVSVRDLY